MEEVAALAQLQARSMSLIEQQLRLEQFMITKFTGQMHMEFLLNPWAAAVALEEKQLVEILHSLQAILRISASI